MPGFVQSYLKKEGVCEFTGINAQEENLTTFIVYPNPFRESSTIRFDNSFFKKDLHLKIYDALGNVVRSEKINSSVPYILNRKNLSTGIYFLRIQDESSFTLKKLVVE